MVSNLRESSSERVPHSIDGPPAAAVLVLAAVSLAAGSVPAFTADGGTISVSITAQAPPAKAVLRNVAVTLVARSRWCSPNPATQVIPSVGPAQVRNVHWDACTTTPGGYVVMAHATAGPFTVESTGQLVQIEPARRPSC